MYKLDLRRQAVSVRAGRRIGLRRRRHGGQLGQATGERHARRLCGNGVRNMRLFVDNVFFFVFNLVVFYCSA